MNEIIKLQKDKNFFKKEGDKYCLISLIGKDNLTKKNVEHQANFCIIEILTALKENKITKKKANDLINQVDLFEYTTDMLGPEKVISKLNKEIIEKELHIPFFNSLCVICEELYDNNW